MSDRAESDRRCACCNADLDLLAFSFTSLSGVVCGRCAVKESLKGAVDKLASRGELDGLDSVRVALTYAPIGVRDAARAELSEALAARRLPSFAPKLAERQAELDELRPFARDAARLLTRLARFEGRLPVVTEGVLLFTITNARLIEKVTR